MIWKNDTCLCSLFYVLWGPASLRHTATKAVTKERKTRKRNVDTEFLWQAFVCVHNGKWPGAVNLIKLTEDLLCLSCSFLVHSLIISMWWSHVNITMQMAKLNAELDSQANTVLNRSPWWLYEVDRYNIQSMWCVLEWLQW